MDKYKMRSLIFWAIYLTFFAVALFSNNLKLFIIWAGVTFIGLATLPSRLKFFVGVQ